MRLSNRSYPHPVVGNGDDVQNAGFQAAYEFTSDKKFYYIDVSVQSSSASIAELVKKNQASFVLHVECGNTLYRKAFDFREQQHRVQIEGGRLNGAVEVNCFARATAEITKYRVDGAHPDYGNTAFELRVGDILAVADGQGFEAEHQDTLRHVGSIMVVEESSKPDDHPMDVDFNGEKIKIRLCKQDFLRYKELKSNTLLATHLTTTIVLPVLTEALHVIRAEGGGYDSLKWYRNLSGRLADLGLSENEEYLTTAQVLLDMPIRRAFAAATTYTQTD